MNSTDILIYFAFAIIVYTHLSWATVNDDQILDYSDVCQGFLYVLNIFCLPQNRGAKSLKIFWLHFGSWKAWRTGSMSWEPRPSRGCPTITHIVPSGGSAWLLRC
jgi:hypothetical protein